MPDTSKDMFYVQRYNMGSFLTDFGGTKTSLLSFFAVLTGFYSRLAASSEIIDALFTVQRKGAKHTFSKNYKDKVAKELSKAATSSQQVAPIDKVSGLGPQNNLGSRRSVRICENPAEQARYEALKADLDGN